jgi:uncharacterized protein
VASEDDGEIEFAPRPRRVTLGRVAAALVLLLAAGFFVGLYVLLSREKPPSPAERRVAIVVRLPRLPPAPTQPGDATAPPSDTGALPAPTPPRDRPPAQPLAPAPDPGLVETGPDGPLPIIGADGRQPWRVYARPFDQSDRRPRVAIIITGLGPTSAITESGIADLPGAVTLAFDPYTRHLGEFIARARAQGHEVMLALPMEPSDFPRQDPGPYTLLTSLSPRENLDRLDWVLSRVTGYVGLTNMMGSRFTTSQVNLVPVFEELKKRGLLFVDGRASEQSVAGQLAGSMGVPRVTADDTLDSETTADAIDHHLALLEESAKKSGAALGIGFAYPLTFERIALWSKTLDAKGLALSPASALAEPKATK